MRYVPFNKFDKLVRRLRKLIKADVGTSRRDALAVILGLHGLRVTEVVNLTIGDLDVIDEMISVETLKRGKPRRSPLGPGVFKALKRLAAKRAKSDRLFVTSSGEPVLASWFQTKAREITESVLGGEGLKFHAMRHTFAMRLYMTTKDMQRVKARLGHRSLASTQVYVDAYTELDDRELKAYRKVEVLPGLQTDRKGPRASGTGSRQRRKTIRTSAPSDPSAPNAYPSEKNVLSLGNQHDFREMQRTKTRKSALRAQKTVALTSQSPWFVAFKSKVEEGLAKSAESMKRSG